MTTKLNNWLKLKVDFFQSLPFKKLRKIAGGDTYLIIYQKLMLLTVNSEGHYRLQGIENTVEEELALILDEDVDNVKICIQFMMASNLIQMLENNIIYLAQVSDLVGKNDDSSVRVAAYRERKKIQCNALQSLHVTNVTLLDIEKEKDTEIEKEKEVKSAIKIAFDYAGFNDCQIVAIKEWFQYRKEIKKPYKSQRTLDGLRKELLVNKNLIRDIQWSINRGYQGIYSPNDSSNGKFEKLNNYHAMGDFTGQESGEVEF